MRALAVAAVVVALVGAAHASERSLYAEAYAASAAQAEAIQFLEGAANNTTPNITGPGYYATKKNNAGFVVYTCAGMAKVINEVAKSAKSLTIEVACGGGSLKKDAAGQPQSWPGTDYNCQDITMAWTPTVKGSKLTIKTYLANKNCDKTQKVVLSGGATGNNTYNLPFLFVGTNDAASVGYASLAMTNIAFNGGGKRPGVSIVSAAKATIKGMDVKFCKGYYEGAALEVYDTPVTFQCTHNWDNGVPCYFTDNEVMTGPGTAVGYGGALTVHQEASAAKFAATFMIFERNKASKLGGAFHVYKGFQKATSVTFTSCSFYENTAPYGTVGFTFRADGNPNDPAKGAPLPLKLTFAKQLNDEGMPGTPNLGTANGTLVLAGAYLNSTFDSSNKPVAMPWNDKLPKGGSWTTAGPKDILGKGSLVYPDAAGKAAAWIANAFIDYTLG